MVWANFIVVNGQILTKLCSHLVTLLLTYLPTRPMSSTQVGKEAITLPSTPSAPPIRFLYKKLRTRLRPVPFGSATSCLKQKVTVMFEAVPWPVLCYKANSNSLVFNMLKTSFIQLPTSWNTIMLDPLRQIEQLLKMGQTRPLF